MNRRLPRSLCCSALLAVAGCAEVPQAPPEVPTDIRVLEGFVFPGGRVRIRSAAFASAQPESVFANSLPLDSWAVADSTLTVQMPEERGAYQLDARWLRQYVPLGTVVVAGGYHATRLGPPTRYGLDVIPWGAPNTNEVLVNGDSLLQLVDVESGAVRATFPDSLHWAPCMWVPGPTTNPGVFVLAGRVPGTTQCGPNRSWRLWPTTLLVDSTPGGDYSYRSAAQLGPRLWLLLQHHFISLESPDSLWQETSWGSAHALRVSPRGDLVAVLGGGSVGDQYGMPVFDAATGGVAFRVDSILLHGGGGNFSDGGDTLWAAGTDAAGWWRLFSLDAASGRVLERSDSIPWDTDDVAIDPRDPYLYATGWYSPAANAACRLPQVRVFGRTALDLVTTLFAGADAPCFTWEQPLRALIDPWGRSLFVVGGAWTDVRRLAIYAFDLLP